MTSFAVAAQHAEVTRLPIVEGISVCLKDAQNGVPAAPDAQFVLEKEIARQIGVQMGGTWKKAPSSRGRWLDFMPTGDATKTPPAINRAWETARALKTLPGVAYAEPLTLIRVIQPEDQNSLGAPFGVWGFPYDEATQKNIEEKSAPLDWALEAMQIPAAWKLWNSKAAARGEKNAPGATVRVGHPDTGYTPHRQLLQALAPHTDGGKTYGWNFVDRDNAGQPTADALDRLVNDGFLPNPGHGTGTASIIVSAKDDTGFLPIDPQSKSVNDVLGVAPGARLVPLRVSNSVVHLSFINLVEAFEKAIEEKVDVISLSLGGPVSSQRLDAVVQKALDAGIIVVAAAGNMLPLVVFPARLPGVVAVAASNPLPMPWRYSGMGDAVAITAPGEMVWHAVVDKAEQAVRWNGTSFAAAHVAGIAALWLSYHGKDKLKDVYGDVGLLPFAFRIALQKTANTQPKFLNGGKAGFGVGLVDAAALLQDKLPTKDVAQDGRNRLLSSKQGNWIGLTLKGIVELLRVPTRSPDGSRSLAASTEPAFAVEEAAIKETLRSLLGEDPDTFPLLEEVAYLIGASQPLHMGLLSAAHATAKNHKVVPDNPDNAKVPLISLRRAVLALPLSDALRQRLQAAQDKDKAAQHAHGDMVSMESALKASEPPAPSVRRLSGYSFDPSLATSDENAKVSTVVVSLPFEKDLEPGPVGEYLEVVDVDPATGCAYAPVDLNHPYLLSRDGLAPSEGSPQFHQQMVYAVAMKTIQHFEHALGRPIFWSPLRPWLKNSADPSYAQKRFKNDHGRPVVDLSDQYIQRLRIYPHALREENAYYSPQKRALLFGYFPAHDSDNGDVYPNGLVFTCLSHDIIAHETTHAILDGMHTYFTEPTNPDVYAFHEAFADIVALFSHFSYPEVLQSQIGETRGALNTGSLLVELARQFGHSTGRGMALRNAIGTASRSRKPGQSPTFQRYRPDPDKLPSVAEAHERGSILVAAVFDAYLAIYGARIDDLKRIATGGTGILPQGNLHPDLVNRMADEAAKSARHVLQMCIRAMDYVPPVDITFGEFLRALITADADLVPDDERNYRIAFLEAFRQWGIYPRDVRTLSEESLRWRAPQGDALYLFGDQEKEKYVEDASIQRLIREAIRDWEPGAPRERIFNKLHTAQAGLGSYLKNLAISENGENQRRAARLLSGLDIRLDASGRFINPFNVANMRPARRVGPNNEFLTELVVEIVQTKAQTGPRSGVFRGGATLIVNTKTWQVRYVIYKRLLPHGVTEGNESTAGQRFETDREKRQMAYQSLALGARGGTAAEYYCDLVPGELPVAAQGATDPYARTRDREAMRRDCCDCRKHKAQVTEQNRRKKEGGDGGSSEEDSLTAFAAPREPFALLHTDFAPISPTPVRKIKRRAQP